MTEDRCRQFAEQVDRRLAETADRLAAPLNIAPWYGVDPAARLPTTKALDKLASRAKTGGWDTRRVGNAQPKDEPKHRCHALTMPI